MTQFVITIDTTIKRIGIGYTGDGPQTDISNSELSDIAMAYLTEDWVKIYKTCSSAIYRSRDKPYFDPRYQYRKHVVSLALYTFIVATIGFACGLSYLGGLIP